jgi:hypothetical protein
MHCRAAFADPERLLANPISTMPKRKSQPKPIQSLDDAAVERLLQFFGVVDPDPASQPPVAVQQISDSDLEQWLANNDKEGMRSAILAFLDRRRTSASGQVDTERALAFRRN